MEKKSEHINNKEKEKEKNKFKEFDYPKRYISNGCELRILNANRMSAKYNGFLYPPYKCCITLSPEEANIWIALSSLVKSKQAIGYPIIYSTNKYDVSRPIIYSNERKLIMDLLCIPRTTKLVNLYFEEKQSEYGLKESYLTLLAPDIIFQKAMILYKLWLEGISAINYYFNYIIIEQTNITFKIGELLFYINPIVVVPVLDCTRTVLTQNPVSELIYLNMLYNEYEHIGCNTSHNYKKADSFIYWFLINYTNNITTTIKNLLKTRRNEITTLPITSIHVPGTIVQVNRQGNVSIGIIIDAPKNNLEHKIFIAFLIAENIFEIDYVNIEDVFQQSKLLISNSGYIVG